jgi:xanthine dehydrogenase/oxidase
VKEVPQGDTFDYFVYAAACSEVELDVLTGELNILSADIVYDCGISLNPAIDIGQIEGGFVMGIGLYLQEDVVYAEADGELLTQGTWEYKVPCSTDIPEQLKVTLLPNDRNPQGILNSKATGEPPYALAASTYLAVKHALTDSRYERGVSEYFDLDVPATVARRQEAAMIQAKDYVL